MWREPGRQMPSTVAARSTASAQVSDCTGLGQHGGCVERNDGSMLAACWQTRQPRFAARDLGCR
jgi:hypothetical protein